MDYILNHSSKGVLYFLAGLFLVFSFLLAALQQPDLSQKSLAYSQKITRIYATKVVELPVELLQEVSRIINQQK
ncbi:MAG: hypothetical protein KBC21_01095 [Candidatus Pacebacteria bacterium]|nr:hypothetical protein [Candidatus Paceibacterota bacterium]